MAYSVLSGVARKAASLNLSKSVLQNAGALYNARFVDNLSEFVVVVPSHCIIFNILIRQLLTNASQLSF